MKGFMWIVFECDKFCIHMLIKRMHMIQMYQEICRTEKVYYIKVFYIKIWNKVKKCTNGGLEYICA